MQIKCRLHNLPSSSTQVAVLTLRTILSFVMTLSVFEVLKIGISEITSCHTMSEATCDSLTITLLKKSQSVSECGWCLKIWSARGITFQSGDFYGDLMTLNMEISFESKKVINIEALFSDNGQYLTGMIPTVAHLNFLWSSCWMARMIACNNHKKQIKRRIYRRDAHQSVGLSGLWRKLAEVMRRLSMIQATLCERSVNFKVASDSSVYIRWNYADSCSFRDAQDLKWTCYYLSEQDFSSPLTTSCLTSTTQLLDKRFLPSVSRFRVSFIFPNFFFLFYF